jgi:hypothetical protein
MILISSSLATFYQLVESTSHFFHNKTTNIQPSPSATPLFYIFPSLPESTPAE